MRKLLLFLIFSLSTITCALAQNGKISGRIIDGETREPIPFVSVKAISGGAMKGGSQADINGEFSLSPLSPGTYDIEITSIGYTKEILKGVLVSFEKTTRLGDLKLNTDTKQTNTVEITEYKVPLISKDETSTGGTITAKEISKMGSRNLATIVNSVAGVFSADESNSPGSVSIRGNRSGDNAVYVNGVRQFGNSLPPPEALEEASVLTGGIPAQYGDALGGILSFTTKAAGAKFTGGVALESSRPFNDYGYDLVSISATGPLIRSKNKVDENGKEKENTARTILGMYGVVQYQGLNDTRPSAYGYYSATGDKLASLAANPYRFLNGNYFPRANWFTQDSLTKTQAIKNGGAKQAVANLQLDFQPTENISITLGGTGTYGQQKIRNNFNLFNYNNNGLQSSTSFSTFLRFRQSFNTGSENTSLLKNVYYQVQLDLTQTVQKQEDERLKEKLSYYNYYGKYQDTYGSDTINGIRAQQLYQNSAGLSDTLFLNKNNNPNTSIVYLNQDRGIKFIPGTQNPDLASGVNQIYQINPGNIFNQVSNGALINNPLSVLQVNLNSIGNSSYGLTYGRGSIGGGFQSIGGNNAGYSFQNQLQYAIGFQAAADIKKHTIKIGFEFQQREYSYYAAATNLYARGRGYVNGQLLPANAGVLADTFSTYGKNADGTTHRYINVRVNNQVSLDANGNAVGQTVFDQNIRALLGLPVNGNTRLNIDAIDPDKINISQFGINDILNNAVNPMTTWAGYDAYGNKQTGSPSYTSFFTDPSRPLAAFKPTYIAGYIEDKFEINDLIVRLGVRVDRFDINQPVLKDQYSLTRLTTVGETNMALFNGGKFVRPSNIGDDYAIYVNNSASGYNRSNQSSFSVVGFRSGSTFYNAQGVIVNNPREIESNGNVNPWFDVNDIKAGGNAALIDLQRNYKITTDAFTTFKPQVNVMPRVAFSFPISEDALFFAHYDILTQRPASYNGTPNYISPVDYMGLAQPGSFIQSGAITNYISNPNLKPQRKIDYQIGFQQRLTNSSSLKFSAFYQEQKDYIQVVRISEAYPFTYFTDGNQDFGTSKGVTIQYDLRRTNNFQMTASYTLQFAETSSSNFAAGLLANTSNPKIRATLPSAQDVRNSVKIALDYRLEPGQGPTLFGYRVFENAGIHMDNFLSSGTPYTRTDPSFLLNNNVVGSINGSRLPYNFQNNLRVDKSFIFKGEGGKSKDKELNVYVYCTNIFNFMNVLGVYPRTGSTTDEGYLRSSYSAVEQGVYTAQGFDIASYYAYYNILAQNPNFVSQPRYLRCGVSYSF